MELKQILQQRRAAKLRPTKVREHSRPLKLSKWVELHDEAIAAALAADPELAAAIRKATTGRHTLVVRSGPFKYYFSVFRKIGRIKVYRLREPRNKAADTLYQVLKVTRYCKLPSCVKAFKRKGKELFCRPAHAAEYKRLKRAGKLWTPRNLSPGAKARRTVADDVREQRAVALDKMARREQRYKQSVGGWDEEERAEYRRDHPERY